MTDLPTTAGDGPSLPVSSRIRARIQQRSGASAPTTTSPPSWRPGEPDALLAEWIMGRPQIQEAAITQLADLLMRKVSPDGLAVVMEAGHFCMHWRGVRDADSKMVNSVMRGSFLKDASLRREFLSLLNQKN